MKMRNLSKYGWVIMLVMIITVISCKKKEEEPQMIVSWSYTVDATDFKKVTFKNASQNYVSLLWEFGDGQTSTEANPVHVYETIGTKSVKLTATGSGGIKESYSQNVVLADPNEELTKLVGDVSKTWKLLRSTATGRYPLEVGPEDHSSIWWAMGLGNDELAKRPCLLNDEWTFGRDGSMIINLNGDYWAEGGYFVPDNICASTNDPMVGPNGEDLSAWKGGNFTFSLTPGNKAGEWKLKSIGLGAYIGYIKLGNGTETKVPLDYVEYNVLLLTDGPVDTLIIEGNYRWDPAQPGGYWRHVLMHYDDPSQEPPIPGNKPSAAFTTTVSGLTVTFNNTTTLADTYLWEFGDGTTSTEKDPVHTYATDGIYNVKLTATNINGSAEATAVLFLSTSVLTDALLQGAPWKIRAEDKSVFVGPGMGSPDWWSVPKAFFTTPGGTDDWTCMVDDEFIFSAGGMYEYKTNGSARNDSYMGTPNGCWSDAEIAASPGAPFGSCATHTYVFTPATGTSRPIIELTNGPGFAAFIGFYKGYYGGENTDGTKPPNGGNATNRYEVMGYANTGTVEYLFVTVDISDVHDGSRSWSAILMR